MVHKGTMKITDFGFSI